MLVMLTPGNACTSVRPLKNSVAVIHLRFSTSSRNNHADRPPPKLLMPIWKNSQKISRKGGRAGGGGMSSVSDVTDVGRFIG